MKTSKESTILTNILDPFQRFLKIEASGGIILLFFTAFALVWANSSLGHTYQKLWENYLTLGIGNFKLTDTILHWVNDGLMAIFFFVVGLEIKRELIAGELSSLKQASLPIAAALGGMIFPALIYILVNTNNATEGGWGIPMATDIAFSLGVLSLLGKRVPISLKVFLVAFAIVDDLGAVMVIALFYSGDIQWNYLLIGMALYILLVLFNRLNIRYIPVYMVLGWVIWFMFKNSGIHPTIAGVMIAFSIPMNPRTKLSTFKDRMVNNLHAFAPVQNKDRMTLTKEQLMAIDNMEQEIEYVQSPVQKLEHTLHHFVTYVVMPVFALTNAGVVFKASGIGEIFIHLSGTIELSLILGKVIGIFLFTWLSVKLGIGALPPTVKWIHILGLGFLGGMGFTMSLFISNLAFSGPLLLDPAKIGILTGSLIAGILGYIILSITLDKSSAMDK
jgi:NhaA family Na+:H+ antiporter